MRVRSVVLKTTDRTAVIVSMPYLRSALRETETISYFHYFTRVQYETVLAIGGLVSESSKQKILSKSSAKTKIKMNENNCKIK